MFKRTLQILFGVALVMQLSGCFFEDRDHHRDSDHSDHHDDRGHDSGIDVHLHG
jgi:hypothetical protein